MAENTYPKNLLIYAHIDKYCVDIILKNRFVVTDPTKGFNDPLDCYFEFGFSGWEKERIIEQLMGIFITKKGKELNELTQKDHDEIHSEEKRLNSLPESIIKKELSDYSRKIVRDNLSTFLRIRCFSALDMNKTLNNVIFSHYGDSHKGLCYIFDTENLIPIHSRQSLTEVRYRSLELAFENFRRVLQDLLNTFDERAVEFGDDGLITEKFYHIDRWDPETYNRLLKQFEYHCYLVEDLAVELNRAANYIFDKVRENLLYSYRLREGVLLIMSGPHMDLSFKYHRAEYHGDERTDIPYPGLKEFSENMRFTRDLFFGKET